MSPVSLLSLVDVLFKHKAAMHLAEMVSDDIVIMVKNSPSKFLNGKYVGKEGFSRLVLNTYSSYRILNSTKFEFLGSSSKQSRTATAQLISSRKYNDGLTYEVSVMHTLYVDKEDKIAYLDLDTTVLSKKNVSKYYDNYYSSYSYYYENDRRADENAVSIVKTIYAKLDKGSDVSDWISKKVVVNVEGSPLKSMNGKYDEKGAFALFLDQEKVAYSDSPRYSEYNVVGWINKDTKGLVKVKALLSTERTHRNGTKYVVSVQHVWFITRTEKVIRLNVKTLSVAKLSTSEDNDKVNIDPESTLNKLYLALKKNPDSDVITSLFDKDFTLFVKDEPVEALNGFSHGRPRYYFTKLFSPSSSDRVYSDVKVTYKVVGVTEDGKGAIGNIIGDFVTREGGDKYHMKVTQVVWVNDRTGKIGSVFQNGTYKFNGKITDANWDTECSRTCIKKADVAALPWNWGKSEQADLAYVAYDKHYRDYTSCMCTKCAKELPPWTARKKACSMAERAVVVSDFSEALRNNNVGGLLSLLTDNVFLYHKDSPFEALNGRFSGKNAIAQFISRSKTAYVEIKERFFKIRWVAANSSTVHVESQVTRKYSDGDKFHINIEQRFLFNDDNKIYAIFVDESDQWKGRNTDSIYPATGFDYYYYEDGDGVERTKDPRVHVVTKFYEAYSAGKLLHMLNYLSYNVEVEVGNTTVGSLGDTFTGKEGFLQYINASMHNYTEQNANYKAIKMNQNGDFVLGKVTAIHTLKDGRRFNVTIAQAFYFNNENLINRIRTTVYKTHLANGNKDDGNGKQEADNKQGLLGCLIQCVQPYMAFPENWGDTEAELAAIRDSSSGLAPYIYCMCQKCGEHPEVQAWPAREQACVLVGAERRTLMSERILVPKCRL